MKNLFRILMAAAVIFSAVSCAKEDISSTIGGGEVEVTFTADLGQLGTRAYGEADNVDVVYLGVYEANSNVPLSSLVSADGYPVTDGKASITVVLLKDKKYDLVFWAQNKAQTCYNVVWNERKVTVNYDGVKSQNDARDAFFLVENDFHAGHDETIFKLYRPFAQLNAGLNATDVDYVAQNGVDISKFKSQVVVKQVASTLNLLEEATDTALDVADFVDVTYALEAKPTQKLNVSGTDYEYLSMNYLLVDAKQNVDVTYTFVDGEGTEYLRPYYQVPVQRNYRTNILGQLISSPLDFNVIIVPDFNTPDSDLQGDTQTFNVSSQAEFEDALAKAAGQDHIQHLIINLNADVTLNVAERQTLAIGNKNTKDITINGSKSRAAGEYYTLTFNNTNSDWNNVATNGAKLILESLNITNSGYDATNGTWNAHDIVFACEVEMNNVVSLNAIAVEADATFNNTTIYDDNTSTSGSYALWIPTNGQTVTLNKCLIDSTGADNGRGIKIDEQYVSSPAKVTLNVSNTTFKTEKKAAILVKSVAGAEVNASNLDIAGVAADTEYAVWVDEDAAAYYDLVEVTGAQVRLEGSAVVSTQQEFEAALKAGKTQINLAAANFTIPTQFNTAGLTNGTTVTLIGAGEATVLSFNSVAGGADGGLNSYADGLNLVFKNMAVVSPNTGSAYTGGFGRALSATFTNCKYYGQYRAVNANTKFEMCTIDPQTSYIYTDYANADFVDCVFNCSKGKAIQVYNDGASTNTTINVKNCQFTAAEIGYTWDNKPVTAIDINSNGEIFTVNINSSTATGFGVGLQSGNSLHNIKGGANYITIYVDGVQVYNELALVDGAYTIYSAAGLLKFANEVNVNNNKYSGKTVKLANDIDLENAAWTPIGQTGATQFQGTFDGNGKTIYNLNIDKTSETGEHYSSGLFGWLNAAKVKNVTVNGATVKGNHNVGVIAGYLETSGCTIENCHVIGAAVECHHANNDACGDKCGGIVGHAGNAGVAVKDCTVADSTVKAGRDAGQVVGAALAVNVTGCSATNVTVSANGECTGANVRNEVIGRLL